VTRFAASIVSLFLLASCAERPAPPTLRPDQPIAVLPANDRSGGELLISGGSLIDRYVLGRDRITVGEALAAEARFQLDGRGLHVVPHDVTAKATQGRVPRSAAAAAEIAKGKLDALVLYLEIRHWEPDPPVHPVLVIVGMTASLMDPASGEVVWELRRRSSPVPTPGEVTVETANETAVRKVVAEIVSALQPGG